MAFIQGSIFDDPGLTGTSQNDLIFGYSGNDIIKGGLGADLMLGGTGADFFEYDNINESAGLLGMDVIADFEHGVDKIDLTQIDADITGPKHAFIEQPAITGPGQLMFVGNTIYGNVDGNVRPDFAIQVVGTADMSDILTI